MYELLKKLRNHIEEFEEVISLITPFMSGESLELTDTGTASIEAYCKSLEQTDVFLLLEAIFFSANNFHENLIKELENRYTSIVQEWTNAIYDITHNDEIYDYDENIEIEDFCDRIDYFLNSSIAKINKFCTQYLEKPRSYHFNGFEYQVIYKAHIDYKKDKARRAELKLNGTDTFDENDELEMYVADLTTDEYIDNIISEETSLDTDDYDEGEWDIIEDNEKIIKQDNFQVCFVTEQIIKNNNPRVNEDIVEKIWIYLVENNLIANDTKFGIFNHVINHRELPKGADTILWNKNYVDGMWLIKFFRLSVDVFNACFTLRKGGKLHKQKNKIKKGDYSDFSRELLKHDENFLKPV
ncbi:MAG: hypothetical protein JEZ09_08245 [Salinivirgaceae bacterium]|nr:hypothetical protein [Salinivirgaceae bacterium]